MMRFYKIQINSERRSEFICILYLCIYLSKCVTLDQVIIQSARTSDAVRPLSTLLRPLPLYCGRFRSLAAALRITAAALCRSPTVFGVCSLRNALMGHHRSLNSATDNFRLAKLASWKDMTLRLLGYFTNLGKMTRACVPSLNFEP